MDTGPAPAPGNADPTPLNITSVTVQVGLPPDAAPDAAPRPEYDPATRILAAREQAKATELGVSVRTIQSRRARYARQGLWGLVDQRAVRSWEATGRDRVPAVLAALDRRCGGRESHAPDYFARRADGSAVVIDCRPAERRKPRDIELRRSAGNFASADRHQPCPLGD